MSEVEIPHAHEVDDFGKKVGVMVAIIGVLLAVVTIASHREHTAAVVHKTEANDQWAYYQAKKIREYQATVGITLIGTLASDQARAAAGSKDLAAQRDKYVSESAGIQKEAQARDEESHHAEARALRFDLGEGFLELGLVLSSLYFLARKRLFPVVGLVSATTGVVFATLGVIF